MLWPDILPNFLIGLREGLEAGVVVVVLLVAVRQAAAAGPGAGARAGSRIMRKSARLVWFGVLAAIMLSGGFAAVFTSSAGLLSGRAQAAVAGLLSVVAAGLVTTMIFWMRRAMEALEPQPRGEVARRPAIGAGALTTIAFLAVGSQGVQTTLFLWTAARASAQTAGPLGAAAAGLALALGGCLVLYRRMAGLNARVAFNRIAFALIVLTAGAFASGLGDLQQAAVLSGQHWMAFSLTAQAQPGTWWVSLFTGVTDLPPAMTVLQAVAWVASLAVLIPAFLRAEGAAAAPHAAASGAGPWERLADRRPWAVAGALVVVPVLAAGTTIAVLPAADSMPTTVTVTRSQCAPGWTSATAGTHTFTVRNQSGMPGEINLDDASGDIEAEIETIGPGTSAQLTATLVSGIYVFKCFMGNQQGTASQPIQVTGRANASVATPASTNPLANSSAAIKPVTLAELAGPNKQYEAYAAQQLAALARAVTRIRADLRGDDLAAAKQDWLTAQLDWERVGASYDSFGLLGLAVDGLPDGLVGGVNAPQFTGLHRLEYGLWHGQSTATLLSVTATLARSVATVQQDLASAALAGDPANLPIRAHEILEDALRDHLSGLDDQGGNAAFAQTYADAQVTGVVLGYLTPLLNARQPGLPAIAESQLAILEQAVLATRVNGQWESLGTASLHAREKVDAAIDAVLQTLSAVPDLLEVPPTH
jgi:high-affinity iron transporter